MTERLDIDRGSNQKARGKGKDTEGPNGLDCSVLVSLQKTLLIEGGKKISFHKVPHHFYGATCLCLCICRTR